MKFPDINQQRTDTHAGASSHKSGIKRQDSYHSTRGKSQPSGKSAYVAKKERQE